MKSIKYVIYSICRNVKDLSLWELSPRIIFLLLEVILQQTYCSVPEFPGKAFSLSLLSIMLAVDFFFSWQMPFIKLGSSSLSLFPPPFFFRSCHVACRILVPQPGIKPRPLEMKVWSPNHCPAREYPGKLFSSPIFLRIFNYK